MNTIAELVTLTLDVADEDAEALTAALVAREQEIAENLHVFAAKFGLLPPVVAKVICLLGLGEECTPEMQEHIDKQYKDLMDNAKAQVEAQVERYRALGIEVQMPQFVDPLEVVDPLAVEDTPPES